MSAVRHADRIWRLVRGAAALVALVVLVVGVPLGLATFVGWPLPHHVPTVAGLHSALTTRGIPDQVLLDGLACVAWLAWASVVLSVTEEVAAAAKGRGSRQIPIAGAFQPVAARLVAAVLFAGLALGRTAPSTSSPIRAPLAVQLHPGAIAFVADDVVAAAPSSPTPSSPPDSAPSVSAPSVSQPAGASTPVTYAVVRNDTLWSIAQTQLGNPLRWREIFALNEGHLQPDGQALTDPSWIYPGWVLVLPIASPAPSPPVPAVPNAPVPATAAPPTTSAAPSTTAAPATTPSQPIRRGNPGAPAVPRVSKSVMLPSGSVIAPSFAAGVLATIAVGRLRRRRRYRPSDPRPGRDLRRPPLVRTLNELRQAAAHRLAPDENPNGAQEPAAQRSTLSPDPEPASPPIPTSDASSTAIAGPHDFLEVGTRDDESVSLNLASLGAVNLVGPSANNVVRAWCAAVLTAAGPGGAEILTTVSVVDDLFSDLRPTPAIRSVSSSEALLGGLEAEIVGRSRQLDDADVPDAASYRAARPEDPLPFLLGVVDQAPGISTARWRALCDSAGRLDVAVIVLGNHQLGTTQIATDSTRTVTSASPADLKQQLEGAMLFGLDTHEARELIDAVISAHEEGSAEAECDGSDPEGSLDQAPEEPVQKWPVEPMTQSVGTSKPIRVRLLGPYQISAHGEEVTKGLRSAAKELLAWYLLRPEGASAEAAVDALWPDTSPEFVTKRFWRALGDLRSRLRLEDSSEKDAILIRSGDHYHPQGDKLTCDLWDFQDHLSHAARADKDNEALYALRRAVDVYRGDFVSDADYLWIGPIREDLHRRALDAHLRLAELEEAFGNDDAAVDVLSHAIQVDQYAEEVFRRLMALQGRIGRSDSIAATWRVLERNLANLELDPELASVRVYQELTHSDDSVSAAATSRR